MYPTLSSKYNDAYQISEVKIKLPWNADFVLNTAQVESLRDISLCTH
jgi:hypothetical protein